jgi:hypothetical protein
MPTISRTRQQRHIVLGYQSDIEGLSARFKADSREVEMKQLQKRAFVEGAITQGKIDSETVLNMQNVGYSEGTACWQKQERCTDEWYERTQNKIDEELNDIMSENCNLLAEGVCGRAYKDCE